MTLTYDEILKLLRQPGAALCRLPGDISEYGIFANPVKILTAQSAAEVVPLLSELEEALAAGFFAAGFIAYEAAHAFDRAFNTLPSEDFPAACVAVYAEVPRCFSAFPDCSETISLDFEPEISHDEYCVALERIAQDIVDGDIYQANFTFRNYAPAVAEPERLFLGLVKRHPVPYPAFFNTGEFKILSLSPELFLEKSGRRIKSSPMKGTAKRHPDAAADKAVAGWLAADPKNTAENLMIVDMVRNDFGRFCIPGSIQVDPLFRVDTYHTVHQMISTVHGEVCKEKSLRDILQAAFPPASITGAPKISAVNIISREEKSPRKVYTGALGCFMPCGDFCLNVAIRTLICSAGRTELGIGSGIVYDSSAESEWQEALLKSHFINYSIPEFQVLETMLREKDAGIKYLSEHLARAESTQRYFGRQWNRAAVDDALSAIKAGQVPARLRLLIAADSSVSVEVYPLTVVGWGETSLRLLVSKEKVDSGDVFLYHKTTNRDFYNRHLHDAYENGFDEVVFFNERGELTEGAISNIFLRHGNQWFTPPLTCGLLPGIWRKETLHELNAVEKVLRLEDLKAAEEIILGNSVRGKGVVQEIVYQ
ncbi:MAG: chorismate-binding protein [Victivallaceae bacterium]|jgi:para-aminobenzoate synthetase/4-amino-4-deoxychorismate lyase